MDVYRLTTFPGDDTATKLRSRRVFSIRTENGSYVFTATAMSKVARYLEDLLRTPVIDETGLDGRYTLQLKYEPRDADAFNAELKKHGLALERSREPIDVFVVRDAAETASPDATN